VRRERERGTGVESIGRRSRLGGGQFRGSGKSIYRQGC
jgi:hypothetical protein